MAPHPGVATCKTKQGPTRDIVRGQGGAKSKGVGGGGSRASVVFAQLDRNAQRTLAHDLVPALSDAAGQGFVNGGHDAVWQWARRSVSAHAACDNARHLCSSAHGVRFVSRVAGDTQVSLNDACEPLRSGMPPQVSRHTAGAVHSGCRGPRGSRVCRGTRCGNCCAGLQSCKNVTPAQRQLPGCASFHSCRGRVFASRGTQGWVARGGWGGTGGWVGWVWRVVRDAERGRAQCRDTGMRHDRFHEAQTRPDGGASSRDPKPVNNVKYTLVTQAFKTTFVHYSRRLRALSQRAQPEVPRA